MNQQDLNALTEMWQSDTNWLNEKIDEFFKSAQDHAYALGFARGLKESNANSSASDYAHPPQRTPLTNDALELAAPALLEALKELMSIVSIHSRATKNNFAWAEMDEARAAIAKATGEV